MAPSRSAVLIVSRCIGQNVITMLTFYLDEPLSEDEILQVTEALADAGERPEVKQRHLAFLHPVSTEADSSSAASLLAACVVRAGLKPSDICMLAVPRQGPWRADVLAEAFYQATNRHPYMVQRWVRATPSSPAHRIRPVLSEDSSTDPLWRRIAGLT